jgi:hypothetical protein
LGLDPYPDDFLHAVKVLAGVLHQAPASVLADVQVTPEGNELRYSQYPVEVSNFIKSWQMGEAAGERSDEPQELHHRSNSRKTYWREYQKVCADGNPLGLSYHRVRRAACPRAQLDLFALD